MIKLNTDGYKIHTPLGYTSFYGIRKTEKTRYFFINFKDGKEIRCSTNHVFVTIEGKCVKAKHLKYKHRLWTHDGWTKLRSRKLIKEPITLYDIIQSDGESTYYSGGILSHNCSFLGSSNTLIAGWKLQQLTYKNPLDESTDHFKIYEMPKADGVYCACVDVSEGVGIDSSTISIVDVSEMPYREVAKYKNNLIQPIPFAAVVHEIAKSYDNAYLIIENNSIGKIVADTLYYDYEYENIMTSFEKDGDSRLKEGGARVGLRTTTKTKAIGCSQLKSLIEADQLITFDYDTVSEFSTFAQKQKSYAAEKGKHDDCVMPLVMFAWLTTQPYFSDLFDIDVRMQLRESMRNQYEEDLKPIVFVSDGLDDSLVDEHGNTIDESYGGHHVIHGFF